jgi:hypothetical protein
VRAPLQAMCKAANSKVSNFECCVQSQWWASSSAHRLQTALSQLRSLSINERAPSLHNVPGLLGTLAASCTQLTHMELSPRPLYPSSKDHIRGLLRALGQLSSVDAFPALQCLSIPDAEASEVRGSLPGVAKVTRHRHSHSIAAHTCASSSG